MQNAYLTPITRIAAVAGDGSSECELLTSDMSRCTRQPRQTVGEGGVVEGQRRLHERQNLKLRFQCRHTTSEGKG